VNSDKLHAELECSTYAMSSQSGFATANRAGKGTDQQAMEREESGPTAK
jgi:hypothetical protein